VAAGIALVTALLAGLTLGLVELTKMTWVVRSTMAGVCWLGATVGGGAEREGLATAERTAGVILLVAVYVLNLGRLRGSSSSWRTHIR